MILMCSRCGDGQGQKEIFYMFIMYSKSAAAYYNSIYSHDDDAHAIHKMYRWQRMMCVCVCGKVALSNKTIYIYKLFLTRGRQICAECAFELLCALLKLYDMLFDAVLCIMYIWWYVFNVGECVHFVVTRVEGGSLRRCGRVMRMSFILKLFLWLFDDDIFHIILCNIYERIICYM